MQRKKKKAKPPAFEEVSSHNDDVAKYIQRARLVIKTEQSNAELTVKKARQMNTIDAIIYQQKNPQATHYRSKPNSQLQSPANAEVSPPNGEK